MADTVTAENPRPPGTPSWLTAVRLRPGGTVEPIAWTTAGVLIESHARLVPAARVVVVLEGGSRPRSLRGEVWSACITSLTGTGGMRYRAAIRFDPPVDIGRMTDEEGGL